MDHRTGDSTESDLTNARPSPQLVRITFWRVILVVLLLVGAWSSLWWTARLTSRYTTDVMNSVGWGTFGTTTSLIEFLNIFSMFLYSPSVFLASLFLYLPLARHADNAEKYVGRGEFFTGIVNTHILTVAALMVIGWPFAGKVFEGAVALSLLGDVASTGMWVLIGFHLCEGRFFSPLAGWFLSHVLLCAGLFLTPLLPSIYFFGADKGVAYLVGFLWQLGILVRAGSQFRLFPTGLLPALRRCAPVLLPMAFCLWLLSGNWSGIFFHFQENAGLIPYLSVRIVVVQVGVFLLVAPTFLRWKQTGLLHRDRILILVISIIYFAFNLILHWFRFHQVGSYLVRGIIDTFWQVFVPLCLLRIWVRGRFALHSLFLLLAYFAALLPSLFLRGQYLEEYWAGLVTQPVAILIIYFGLFRPLRESRETVAR
jgi:hypothetical protein